MFSIFSVFQGAQAVDILLDCLNVHSDWDMVLTQLVVSE
jgi:hypothetical protein